jgi:hypothetical protein
MTAAGGWVYRKIDHHKCLPPRVDPDASVGDVWQCPDDGKLFEVIADGPQDLDVRLVEVSPDRLHQVRQRVLAAHEKLGRRPGDTHHGL